MNGHRLCIRLLGELEVVRDGAAVPLPQSKKTRALLAYLAATARSHRRERLCEVFWDLPNDPRGGLRWSLSKLRGVLDTPGQRRLLADRQSVRLDLSDIDVDLLSLRAVLGPDPNALPMQTLERAAQTMRGPFLEGLNLPELPTFHAWCAAEREDARLVHARILRALISRCEPETGLLYARDLVALDPYDIDDRARLIRMLVAQGRTAEAERQVEAGRSFARDLGDEQDSCMQTLRTALRHRPVRSGALRDASPATTGRREPKLGNPGTLAPAIGEPAPCSPPLIGREREWRQIMASFDDTLSGFGRQAVALTGEPGIGKTRLLEELAVEVRRWGGVVLSTMAHETEAARPYGPWIDALAAGARENDYEAFISRPIALFGGSHMGGGADFQGTDRAAIFQEVAGMLKGQAAESGPLLVILDNLQWCDEASVALLHYAVRTCRKEAVIFAVAARAGELPDNPAARDLLHALRSEMPLVEVALAPLDPKAAEQLAAGLVSPTDAARIAGRSRGNPLAVLELARSYTLGEETEAHYLAQVLRARIDRLPEDAKDLLAWCAVLGGVPDGPVLEVLTGQDVQSLIASLGVLERRALLRTVEGGSHGRGVHAFAFDLVRDVVYRDISEPRRRLMHLRVARLPASLWTSGWAGAGQHMDRVRHAVVAEDMKLAAQLCAAGARHCLRVFAYQDALGLARRGLNHVQDLDESLRIPLSLELLQAAHAARRPPPDELEPLAEEIEGLARRALALDCVSHARRGFHTLSYLRWESGTWADAERYMLEAERVSRATSGRERAAALAEAALCLAMIERDLATAEALLLEAAAVAETTGFEPLALIQARAFLRMHSGDEEQARALFERACRLARHEGDTITEFNALEQLAVMALRRPAWADAEDLCSKMLTLAARLPDGGELPFAEAARALCRLGQSGGSGDPELEAALTRLRLVDSKQRLMILLLIAAQVAVRQGHSETARRRGEEALRLADLLDSFSGRRRAQALLASLDGPPKTGAHAIDWTYAAGL